MVIIAIFPYLSFTPFLNIAISSKGRFILISFLSSRVRFEREGSPTLNPSDKSFSCFIMGCESGYVLKISRNYKQEVFRARAINKTLISLSNRNGGRDRDNGREGRKLKEMREFVGG